ncbi:MAG: flagellar hook capping FlgD N-terminal domain-containing protein [Maricaulaceae bacterium]|jgi:flagellar basal-body rod modification protein FlgD
MIDALTSAAASAQETANSRTSLAQNFEMFMTLLTEQLKNQDPLSPLDSNEFVSQLVEFSSVEQLINQNDSLETLVGLQVAGIGGATVGYLGKEVSYASATTGLGPDGARWTYSFDEAAETVSIAVLDETGKVVFGTSGEGAQGAHDFVWDGLDNQGNPAPPGAYTLEIGATTEGGEPVSADIVSKGVVTGVDLSGAEPVLLINGARAPFSTIFSVQEPSAPNAGGDSEPES